MRKLKQHAAGGRPHSQLEREQPSRSIPNQQQTASMQRRQFSKEIHVLSEMKHGSHHTPEKRPLRWKCCRSFAFLDSAQHAESMRKGVYRSVQDTSRYAECKNNEHTYAFKQATQNSHTRAFSFWWANPTMRTVFAALLAPVRERDAPVCY